MTSAKQLLSALGKPATVAVLAAATLTIAPLAATAAPTADATAPGSPAVAPAEPGFSVQGAGDGTPAGAVQWFRNRIGSTAYQELCEKAVENAYGVTGVWASANAHWFGASPKHPGNHNPPTGAFVYWNIGQYGHVGISDGAGGFYATSVGGRIGHVTKSGGGYSYYRGYRGWTPAAVPRR
ncbi:CHAP domain-containing protein [Amycolatopsis marina]|uniref:CHAP domain-containing protein n=1 Tax=Amycolatopsis marina TaxID=490629 RepID=UPI000B86CED1